MKLRDDIRYAASLRDGDNQILSSGEVLLRPAKSYGVFWPHPPANEDLILKNAKILQVSDEVTLKIQTIFLHRCEEEPQEQHFEIHFEPV